ncbi:transcription factor MYBS3-like isoform X1 [Typha angustifolia]|uniref:transcription factor MYBS3-like isoform X1 n=1 Tax=Typha angustifolia TaxID=59011 RepID=UPI003C307839
MKADNGEDSAMRRCSQCGQNGHNSRTCPSRVVRLFGVRLTDAAIRKSTSTGNIVHYAAGIGGGLPGDGAGSAVAGERGDGYASEQNNRRIRKKGVPWTEKEHKMFLQGLRELGKGDWRGISHRFVLTRTPTQVASHAQKFFFRHSNLNKRKKRASLFDIVPDESADIQLAISQDPEKVNNLQTAPEVHPEESVNLINGAAYSEPEALPCSYPVAVSACLYPMLPVPFPVWPAFRSENTEKKKHEIVKPMAVHSRIPIKVDGLVGMECCPERGLSSLPHRLSGSHRQSAFHANFSTGASKLSSHTSPIQTV